MVAWNDAVFSPSDFHNIARIGQDSKIDAPAAAGRFGLGFNAVYHFTDVPSFVSGEYLVMFDPHATHLPGATPARPGLKIAFAASPLLSQFPDQFAGYLGTFGCDLTRDPCRRRCFGFRSVLKAPLGIEIKPEAYTADDVRRLFEQFRPRAAQTLLFLKNVRKISVYERGGRDGRGRRLGRAASSVRGVHPPRSRTGSDPRATVLRWVAGAAGEVAGAKRRAFFDRLRDVPEASLPSSVGWMDLTVRSRATRRGYGQGRTRGVRGTVKISVWVVSAFPGPSRAVDGVQFVSRRRGAALALSDVGKRRGLVPWVGVAARVPHRTAVDGVSVPKSTVARFVFCPSPRARFSRARQRVLRTEQQPPRHLVRRGHGRRRRGAERVESSAVGARGRARVRASPCFRARVALGSVPAYYALFPVATSAAEPWSLALPPLYASLARLETLRAMDPRSSIVRWTAAPRSAFFPDPSGGRRIALAAALRARARASHRGRARGRARGVRVARGKFVSNLIPRDGSRALARIPPAPSLDSARSALQLLAYCISDVDPDDASSASDLRGTPLVPLADGTLGVFAFRDPDDAVRIAERTHTRRRFTSRTSPNLRFSRAASRTSWWTSTRARRFPE